MQIPLPAVSSLAKHSYQIKIFDCNSKRNPRSVRQLYGFTGKFKSIKNLRDVLHSELGDDVPHKYSIGYYEGRNHSKKWLTIDQDLVVMNQKIPSGDVCLWCDAQDISDENHSRERSPIRSTKCGKREEKEKEIDEIFQDLKNRHGDGYSGPQLRLWARMIHNGVYEDQVDPPQVPMITGKPGTSNRPKSESLTEALTGAATAFAKVFKTSPSRPTNPTPPGVGISPCKAAELRMKHLEQLRYIQQLMEDQILSESEFMEQKEIILNTLRKMAR